MDDNDRERTEIDRLARNVERRQKQLARAIKAFNEKARTISIRRSEMERQPTPSLAILIRPNATLPEERAGLAADVKQSLKQYNDSGTDLLGEFEPFSMSDLWCGRSISTVWARATKQMNMLNRKRRREPSAEDVEQFKTYWGVVADDALTVLIPLPANQEALDQLRYWLGKLNAVVDVFEVDIPRAPARSFRSFTRKPDQD